MPKKVSSKTEYSASLTGNPFLFFETRIIAAKISEGCDTKSLSKVAMDQNLFQYKTTKSIPKRVNSILRRLDGLDRSVLELLASGPVLDAKAANLLVIAHSDRLFAEFLEQVVREKAHLGDATISDGDMKRFFEAKAETSSDVAGWGEMATKKLQQVYINILVGAGILNNRKQRHIQRPLLSPETRRILGKSFPPQLIRIIEG